MRERILIIDDETDFCGIMKNYFQKRNYEVRVAYSIKEGMDLMTQLKPDFLLLDNHLPDGMVGKL